MALLWCGFRLVYLVALVATAVCDVVVVAVSVTSAVSHAQRDEWQTSVGKW